MHHFPELAHSACLSTGRWRGFPETQGRCSRQAPPCPHPVLVLSLPRTLQASEENKGLLSPAHCGHVDPKEKGSSWASHPTPDPSLWPFAGPAGQRGWARPLARDSLCCSFSCCWYLTHVPRRHCGEGQKQGRGWLPATGLVQGCGASQGPLLHPRMVRQRWGQLRATGPRGPVHRPPSCHTHTFF